MARKTYRTFRFKGLQLFVKGEDGRPIEINFRGGIQIDSTAKFTTSDEQLQKKIEALDVYGKSFYLESVEDEASKASENVEPVAEPAPEQEERLTDIKDIKRFRNIIEMKNYMADLGIAGVQDMNYAQAKSAAKKAGYDFQISKDK